MKKVILSVAIVMAIGLTSCKNEAKQETTNNHYRSVKRYGYD